MPQVPEPKKVASIDSPARSLPAASEEAGEFVPERFFEQSFDLPCVAGVDGYFRRVNPAWVQPSPGTGYVAGARSDRGASAPGHTSPRRDVLHDLFFGGAVLLRCVPPSAYMIPESCTTRDRLVPVSEEA